MRFGLAILCVVGNCPFRSVRFSISSMKTVLYGSHSEQYIDLSGDLESCKALCILIHGGFWKEEYDCRNTPVNTIADELGEQGFMVAMLEYRRVGHEGGGYPGTVEDVQKAYDFIVKDVQNRHPNIPIVLIGHSAGGTLVQLLCLDRIQVVRKPNLCISIAPVADLVDGYNRKLSDNGDAIPNFMKCFPTDSEQAMQKYLAASPSHDGRMSDLQKLVLVSGSKDVDIPPELVSNYFEYAKTIHINCVLIESEGEDHLEIATAGSNAYREMIKHIDQVCRDWPLN